MFFVFVFLLGDYCHVLVVLYLFLDLIGKVAASVSYNVHWCLSFLFARSCEQIQMTESTLNAMKAEINACNVHFRCICTMLMLHNMWSQSNTMTLFIAYDRIWCLCFMNVNVCFYHQSHQKLNFLTKLVSIFACLHAYMLMHAYLHVCVSQCAHTVILYDCALALWPWFSVGGHWGTQRQGFLRLTVCQGRLVRKLFTQG